MPPLRGREDHPSVRWRRVALLRGRVRPAVRVPAQGGDGAARLATFPAGSRPAGQRGEGQARHGREGHRPAPTGRPAGRPARAPGPVVQDATEVAPPLVGRWPVSKRVVTIDAGRSYLVVRLESGLRGKLVARCTDPVEADRIAAALDPEHAQEQIPDG